MTETTIPTAESLTQALLAQGFGAEATRPDKASYSRIRVDGRTLAYADDRKDGFVLSFAPEDVEGAPGRFQKSFETHGGRTTLRVTAKNEKGARDLLEWVAKHVQQA